MPGLAAAPMRRRLESEERNPVMPTAAQHWPKKRRRVGSDEGEAADLWLMGGEEADERRGRRRDVRFVYFCVAPAGEVAMTRMARWTRSRLDVPVGNAVNRVVSRSRVA